MSHRAPVVPGTNVLVSAALRPGSVPWQMFDRTLTAGVLAVCDQSIAELEGVLMRAKLDRFAIRERRAAIPVLIRARAVFATVKRSDFLAAHSACRDAGDELFLALALAAQAATIVSGDADLLTLGDWRGTAIRTSAQYLAQVA